MSEKLAIVRVRGGIGIKTEIKDTLKMLNLHRKNFCVVVPNNDSNLGMIKRVKDYVTYGNVDEETYKLLVEKRGEKKGDKEKPFFRLAPPKKGFGRKGVKVHFSKGGALGYRDVKINDLIKRMI
jgi:large subunit ribosomal protein L30